MEKRNQITFSIVTVCRNCVDSIEKTLLSVLNQTYPHVEYIVIDGNSTDGTSNIIRQYQNHLTWIREPDKGIYDAMNKGASLASGDYIYFLNSNDTFFAPSLLAETAAFLENKNPDLLCGNVNYIYEANRIELHDYSRFRRLNRFWLAAGITVCHQAVFAKTSLVKKYKFDLSYTIWADQNFFAVCMQHRAKVEYYNRIVCNFDAYGFSSGADKKGQSRKECDRINQTHNPFWYRIFWLPKWLVRKAENRK